MKHSKCRVQYAHADGAVVGRRQELVRIGRKRQRSNTRRVTCTQRRNATCSMQIDISNIQHLIELRLKKAYEHTTYDTEVNDRRLAVACPARIARSKARFSWRENGRERHDCTGVPLR